MLTQKANLEDSIVAADVHADSLQDSTSNCRAYLARAQESIPQTSAKKDVLLPELEALRSRRATGAKRAEVEMLEKAWPGEPCANSGDSGPTRYKWSTLSFAIEAKSLVRPSDAQTQRRANFQRSLWKTYFGFQFRRRSINNQ